MEKIREELKDAEYTIDEFEAEGNALLKDYYGDTVKIIKYDNNTGVVINNSYLVTDKYVRQKISVMLENTGLTEYTAGVISAEWLGHNMLIWAYDGAKKFDFEFAGDGRSYVKVGSYLIYVFGGG